MLLRNLHGERWRGNLSYLEYRNLFDFLSSLDSLYSKNILLVGDFNIPGCCFDNFCDDLGINPGSSDLLRCFLNFINYLNLSQVNSVTNFRHNLLDLVIANRTLSVTACPYVLMPLHHVHPALLISFKFTVINKNELRRSHSAARFKFTKASVSTIFTLLTDVDWSFMNSCSHVNSACVLFYK